MAKRLLVLLSMIALMGFADDKRHYDGPIIDVHLHAGLEAVPFYLCVPLIEQFPPWDTRKDWADVVFEALQNPLCEDPIPPQPSEEDQLLKTTIAQLENRNAIGILSGSPEEVKRWRDKAPAGMFLPSLQFRAMRSGLSDDALRKLLSSGDFIALGEVGNQYDGLAPNHPSMDAYWALAQELDIPVAYHMGEGLVGTAYLGMETVAGYRAALSNPLLLEEVLIKYPRLRVSVMHYGAPFVDEMIAMLASHPQIYVDIGGIQWFYPKPLFYSHLKKMVDAGFGKRIMFGSDQGDWPGVIGPSIDIINEAPFLTYEQKADIFHNNAVRFFRLNETID